MRLLELVASVLLLSSTTSAWPRGWNGVMPADIAPIMRRQDNGDSTSKFDLSFSAVQGNTATTESLSEQTGDATSSGDNSQTTDGNESGTQKPTGSEKTTGTAKETGSGKGSGTNSGSQTTKTFDARLPAGGVSMLEPNVMTTTYFKINNYVTFAWNYTSLSVTPSAIDILASCSLNQETYTIALNQTVQKTQSVIWDTGAYQATATVPLLTETYTLIIHDAAQDVTARAMAGYLGTYDQFTFGMYSPQAYTPMNEFVCATCNSAMSAAEKQTLLAIFGMVGLTVLSFGWFTGIAGLW